MKFLDLFAGIGGFRLGMESAGHECVGFCEIDKFARESYKAIHNTEGEVEMHDITTVSDEFVRGFGNIDIICGGFPCQAFSTAGKRRGFEDTRGTLFFEIARFASILRPKYLFLENVVGLLTHDGGATFATILGAMDELGYNVEWQVFNSKNFGVPQHRERVFIVGHLRGASTKPIFPFGRADSKANQNHIRQVNDSKKIREQLKYESIWRVIDPEGISPTLDTMQGGNREPKIIQRPRGHNKGGEHKVAPTVTSNSYHENNYLKISEATTKGYSKATAGDSVNLSHPGSETRRGRVGKKQANTLMTGSSQGVVTEDLKIRKLTPRECWRLQGFPDWAFDKASKVNSNSQLYKQAGNSVTVNVIEAIAKRL